MNQDLYRRTIDQLEQHACKWWPAELREVEQSLSLLPVLLDSQEQFLSILRLSNPNRPEVVFRLIDDAGFPLTLFLKHLIVLTDFGSEPLQRVNKDFRLLFPDGVFTYSLGNRTRRYRFQALPVSGSLSNQKMCLDTEEHLLSGGRYAELYQDLIMLLLYGSAAENPRVRSVLYKCAQYKYLGSSQKLDRFVRQNYIRVSKIMAGSTATALGNAAQQYVVDYLSAALGEAYTVKSNGKIPGISQNEGLTDTSFDVVVDRRDDTGPDKKYVAIEVSFQETTNSTIERKSGQAHSRYEAITATGSYIAYIIDGAGNFARRSAISVICGHSHCTVAYTKEELDRLVSFIRERIG